MPSIQVKHVPEATHRVLRRRAAANNQSLQEYLLQKLVADAERETLDEVLDRIGHRTGGDAALTVTADLVRNDRDRG